MLSVATTELISITNYLQSLHVDLNSKQLQAVSIVALGGDDDEIVSILGVQRVTIWRWKKEDSFQKAVAMYGNLLCIYGRVHSFDVAVELMKIFRKRLQLAEIQLVIDWLKQEVKDLTCLYPDLNYKQIQAIELIVKGENIAVVGKRIGTSRGTVWRWCNHELVFQKAMKTHKAHSEFDGSLIKFSNFLKLVELLQKHLQASEFSYALHHLKIEDISALA